jgi:hypothetical protein
MLLTNSTLLVTVMDSRHYQIEINKARHGGKSAAMAESC